MRKDHVATDEELGVSSAQRMAGEDPDFLDRKRRQQNTQRGWLEQQCMDKESVKEEVKVEQREFAETQSAMIALRLQIEKEEEQVFLLYNINIGFEPACRPLASRLSNRKCDLA